MTRRRCTSPHLARGSPHLACEANTVESPRRREVLEAKDAPLAGACAEVALVAGDSRPHASQQRQRSYADLRDMLVAKDAPLWREDAAVALVAAMSLPSSKPTVRHILEDLRELSFPMQVPKEKLLVPCRVLHMGGA